jgi:hypothetical protein
LKPSEFLVEASCLLAIRCRLVSQLIASHVIFEGNFWGATVVEFLHSLGRKLPVKVPNFQLIERLLWVKADLQNGDFKKKSLANGW